MTWQVKKNGQRWTNTKNDDSRRDSLVMINDDNNLTDWLRRGWSMRKTPATHLEKYEDADSKRLKQFTRGRISEQSNRSSQKVRWPCQLCVSQFSFRFSDLFINPLRMIISPQPFSLLQKRSTFYINFRKQQTCARIENFLIVYLFARGMMTSTTVIDLS